MIINLVSELHESIWQREAGPVATQNWVYSKQPIQADVYVIYGKVEQMLFTSSSATKIFIAIEPPEIFCYDLSVLAQYDLVVAPDFPYMRTLRNRLVRSGLLNWSIGTVDHVHNLELQRELPGVETIRSLMRSQEVSVIMSLKSITPLQKRRVKFIHELKNLVPELQIFGRHSRPISDKLDGLLPYRFHLALENSIHPHYWTEKLADPLLCLAKVFYVGDPLAVTDFDDKCIVPLDIYDASSSARIIHDHLNRGVSEAEMSSLVQARRKIIFEKNMHRIVEEYLQILREGERPVANMTSIPAHRVKLRSRARFAMDRLQLTVRRRNLFPTEQKSIREGN